MLELNQLWSDFFERITIQHEIAEEVGIKASELVDLGVVGLDTSIVRCPVQMFLAK